MKSLLLVFVAAVSAAPEADPLTFAYSVGTPLVYTHAAAPLVTPVQYLVPAVGCRNNEGALVPCNGAVPFLTTAPAAEEPAVEAVDRKRREAEPEAEAEAEADPEADPWLYYSGLHSYAPYTYSYGFPYAYRHAAYAYAPYSAYHYAAPYIYGRKKREAEAEADAEADPYLLYYSGFHGYAPYTYSYGFPYAYHAVYPL